MLDSSLTLSHLPETVQCKRLLYDCAYAARFFLHFLFIYINVVARTGTACPLGQRRHGRMVPRVGGTTRLRPEMVFEGGKWW